MVPEELESWFENEKNNLEKEYLERLKNGEASDIIRADFDKRMFEAIRKYEDTHLTAIRPVGIKKMQSEWNKKITNKIYKFMNELTEKFRE